MLTLAVVALSARAMAVAAARDACAVIAIDLFGDTDTRRASQQWLPAGLAGSMCIDSGLVLGHLRGLAQRGGVAGWVAGSGCEGLPALLAEGATLLPLVGSTPAAVQRVRDPVAFFGWLDTHGIGHPEVRFSAPADPAGWLVKDATACGGAHVRAASAAHDVVAAQAYYQRRVPGTPMSATFCANGSDATVLGFNLALLRGGAHAYAYGGVVGPVALPAAAAAQATRTLRLMAREMALQGLGSLDFMLEGDTISVLEVNPRPSASLSLYTHQVSGGVMSAHVLACLQQRLPQAPAHPPGPAAVRGEAVVFSPRALQLGAGTTATLHQTPDCHDLPAAATRFAAGDPFCSVSASGPDAGTVQLRLRQRHDAVLDLLENL